MAKAAKAAGLTVNGTVGEMLELQQAGGLISSKIIPHFAEAMHQAAINNNGLTNALKSNRVAMNRMKTAYQNAADEFFKSGFSEGLTTTFESINTLITENQDLWNSLGKIVGSVLRGVSKAVKLINPLLSALGSILHGVTSLLGDFSGALILLGSPAVLMAITAQVTSMGTAMGFLGKAIGFATKAFTRFFLPVFLVLGALEEIAEFFSPTGKRTMLGVNIDNIGDKMKDKVMPWKSEEWNQKYQGRNQMFNMWKTDSSARPVSIQMNVNGEVLGQAAVNSVSGQEGITNIVENTVVEGR